MILVINIITDPTQTGVLVVDAGQRPTWYLSKNYPWLASYSAVHDALHVRTELSKLETLSAQPLCFFRIVLIFCMHAKASNNINLFWYLWRSIIFNFGSALPIKYRYHSNLTVFFFFCNQIFKMIRRTGRYFKFYWNTN
jgi:hypothetical protein